MPMLIPFQPGEDLFPLDSDGKVIGDETDFVDTWEVSGRTLPVGSEADVFIPD